MSSMIKFERNPNAKVKFGFIGVPWDQGDVGGVPGCRYAPKTTRKYVNRIFDNVQDDNMLIDCYDWSLVDLSELMVKDFGDVEDYKFYDVTFSIMHFADKVREIAEQGFNPIVCGGDCSINFSAVKGLHDSTDKKVGVIYVDGHPDIWPDTHKIGRYSHSSPLARINELERVDGNNIVHLGMRGYRGLFASQDYNYMKDNGITMETYAKFHNKGVEQSVKDMLEIVKKGTDKVALAIDIDALEMAFAPGSSTNEPCGPDAWEICEMIRLLAPHVDCLSVTEVNPLTDFNNMTSRRTGRMFLDYIINNYKGNK